MNKEYRSLVWEIQHFDPYRYEWIVLDVCLSEDNAMKRAPFYAYKCGEVRIVKHEEIKTILGTMKRRTEK